MASTQLAPDPTGTGQPSRGPDPDPDPRQLGPLGRLAGLTYRNRGKTVLAWIAALVLVTALSTAFAGSFAADYTAPGSDSKQAQTLLKERFPAQSGDTVDVVVRTDSPVTDQANRAATAALLAALAKLPHVAGVADPFTTPGSIAPDGRTLVAHARLDVVNPNDMPVKDTQQLMAAADKASHDGFQVDLNGQTIEQAEQGSIGSEGIGLAAAAVILLITFGSVVAAGLPILVAVAGLAVGGTLIGLVAALVDVPDWSTSLAAMMCIGIGIDYVLLMVTRFREWRAAGLDTEAATVATLDTAGRSVMIAGTTVVISMMGLFAMGLSFMRGAALATITSVLVVMVAATTLFPALLGYLGRHIDRWRLPIGKGRRAPQAREVTEDGHTVPSAGWVRWSRWVDSHSVLAAVLGVTILLVLASPFLAVRFGFPDAGNDVKTATSRQAYDAVAAGFGPGSNGPLVLVAELDKPGDLAGLNEVVQRIESSSTFAAVTPPQVNAAGDTAVVTVVPVTGPQDPATEQLVHQLRDDVIPAATAGTGTTVHVGGVTAAGIDSTANIAKRLPLLIGGVVLLSMLVLLVSFRSLAIPVKAAVMNLLSVAAAYGVVAFAMQGGWFGQLLGIDTPTPVPAFIPVLMFAVLFGLSMDYEVFLVSRMRESWLRHRDNNRAIVDGLAGTGRVITAAALIMVAVFAAFIPSPMVFLKVIGVGMAAAIFVDATVVRMLLVPAVMHLLGARNWWLPAWLDRAVPQLHVEGRPELHLPARQPEPAFGTDRPANGAPEPELAPAG